MESVVRDCGRAIGGLHIRRMESRDIEAILSIQGVSPEIAQWAVWDYERVARGEMAGWVAEGAGQDVDHVVEQVIGFLIARSVGNEVEILNLAVHPEARRQGVGSALLEEAVRWSRGLEAKKALLEVRASNVAALQFYERHQFQAIGKRAGYYRAPLDDALVLSLNLA